LSELTDQLPISEWDLRPSDASQILHFMAALVQGALAASGTAVPWNIRSLLSADAGWIVYERADLDSTALQDGAWEIANCMGLLAE
jgi:hypothetical protein